jgi:predicted aconitase
MQLTNYEKSILDGDFGDDAKKIMEVMVKIYEINDAQGFIEVNEVMLASTQNMSIGGEMGMELLTRLADSGIRFKVKTITDPVSIDLEGWQRLGIPKDYAKKQQQSVDALIEMGAIPTWTCTPYLVGSISRYGDHLAWVETSCVIFANSYFGARTNREMDISALAAAITGKTPCYGLHLADNREGQLLVNVETDLNTTSDFDALGNYVGKIAGTQIPVFKNIKKMFLFKQSWNWGQPSQPVGLLRCFTFLRSPQRLSWTLINMGKRASQKRLPLPMMI